MNGPGMRLYNAYYYDAILGTRLTQENACAFALLFVSRLGASIVVDSPALLSSFSDILFNPKCFVLYEDRTAPPSEWNNVSRMCSYFNTLYAPVDELSNVQISCHTRSV